MAVEVWQVPLSRSGYYSFPPLEPAIDKVKLNDSAEILVGIGEPLTVEGKKEITESGGWRAYQKAS